MTACGNKLIIMVAISNEGCVMYECGHICVYAWLCMCGMYASLCVYVCVSMVMHVCMYV